MPGSAVIGNLAVNLSMESAAFSDGATKAQAQMRALSGEARNMTRGLGSFNATGKLSSFHMQNLAFQANDMFVSLASGQAPLRVFIQQGSQIAQIGAQAGVGLGGMARAVVALLAPFAGVAAGAGLLAAAFLGVKQAADDTDLNAYIATLGLTDDQIKKLKGTTVSWGDVTTATFQVLAEKAGTSSAQISGFFSRAFSSVGEFGKFSVAVILGAFGAMVKGVADIATNLPAIVGGAFTAATNLGIAAIEKLLNVTVAGLNKASGFINSVFGTSIGTIAEVHLPRLQSSFVGTMKAIGADVSGTFHSIFNRTEATFDQISARAVQLRKNDLAAQAAALKSADAAGKAAKGHEDRAKAVKHEADEIDKLTKNLSGLLAKEAEVDSDLSNPKPLAKIDLPDKPLQSIEKVKSAWQEWADTVPQQASEIANAFGSIATRGLDGIGMAIADIVTGARSLKDAFADVAKSIISDIIQMSAKMLIFRALSAAFGGGFDVSSFNATVAENNNALGVNLPGFASGGSGVFGGFGGIDQNVLSMNGSPIARVSKGEAFSVGNAANSNGRIVVELRDDMLDARIADGANVQIVRSYPAVKAGVVQHINERSRRAG